MYSKPKGIIFLFELVVHGIGVQEYRTPRLLVLADYNSFLIYICYGQSRKIREVCGNLFRCSLPLCVATLCERFLSWWFCIFDWVLLLVLCDFGLSCKYIKYLFGSSFVLVSLENFVEAFWLLWICGVAPLLWCGAGSLVP